MKIVIVSAHPDDETLGMGGTILKLKKTENQLIWILVTIPELKKDREKVNRYIKRITKFYNYDDFYWLKFPVTKLGYENLSDLILQFRKIFIKINPEIVFTVSDTDIHSDHLFTYKGILSSLKPFRENNLISILKYEVLSSTHIFPSNLQIFKPNVFSDITDYIDTKIKAFQLFEKEIQPLPFPRNAETIKALSRLRGSSCGVMYAEAFELVFGRLTCLQI